MLKITGGSLRGRRIAAPAGRSTRPTAEKVRESIFNTLRGLVALEQARVLDLFAGSGALGIEALSRGAAHAVFVESHGRTAAGVKANLKRLELAGDAATVITAPVEKWLARPNRGPPAGLVLADPPYGFGAHEELLKALAASPAVAPEAVIVLECAHGMDIAVPDGLDPLRTKRYGDTQVFFFAKSGMKGS